MVPRPHATANEVAPPRRFGQLRRLGDGSEGGAFRAHDEELGRTVVLKRVPTELRAQVADAFAVLRRTGSPHLPAPLALVDDPRTLTTWMVTSFVEGRPLVAGPTGFATLVGEAHGIAHALAAIHRTGAHHGDVSPNNVLLTPTGGIVLVDLGHLSRLGTGTPGFLAPEVLAGGGGPAADRFALGCLMVWRACGQVPWVRPEQLLAVRGTEAVRHRLEQLGSAAWPRVVVQLITALLDPDPARREPVEGGLVERLHELRVRLDAGAEASVVWTVPTRWPYRGVPLRSWSDRLRSPGRPKLLAIAGPEGSGRRRVVEELVQELQTAGTDFAVAMASADRGALAFGRPNLGWLAAWMEASAGTGLVALDGPPPWQGPFESVGLPARARMLTEAARVTDATLLCPVSVELGRELRAIADDAVAVLEVEPWTGDELERVLTTSTTARPLAPWVQRLQETTLGWPAAVVRTLAAWARAGVETPSVAALHEALERSADDVGLELDDAQAKAVLEAFWCPDRSPALPRELCDRDGPRPLAIVAARRRLGPDALRSWARIVAAEGVGTLALALDADDADAVEHLAERALASGTADTGALLTWLEADGVRRVGPGLVERAVRRLLADGASDRALRLCERAPDAPELVVQRARALQRLGRAADAVAMLDAILVASDGAIARQPIDDDLRGQAIGLRWRSLVDLGRSAEVLTAAEALLERDQVLVGVGWGTALLWAGFAAAQAGTRDRARAWLLRAERAVADCDAGEALGVRARVWQLLGNAAHERGDLEGAVEWFDRAAGAFATADEPVGETTLRGSLAALAVPLGDLQRGLAHGRRAFRALLARGEWTALVDAGLNLVQCLARVGALDEARRVRATVTSIVDGLAVVPALVRGRTLRIDADVETMAAVGSRDASVLCDAARRYVAAAEVLQVGGSGREAIDAAVRSAALFRRAGALELAADQLDAAERALGTTPDEGSRVALLAERIALASDRSEPRSLHAALRALAAGPGAAAMRRDGQLDLAIVYDRALLRGLRECLPEQHEARMAAAQRLCSTLEAIMDKTPPADRSAVRASYLAEDGDVSALRDLLEELEPSTRAPARTSGPTVGPEMPSAERRFDRLLRMYRRFAREDRLEPLLEQVVDAVMELTDAERGAVVVRHGDRRFEVARELVHGSDGFKFSHAVIERVLQGGEPVVSVDAAADARFDGSRSISHLNLRSVLAVPLRFRGELLGAVYVDHRLRRGNFDEHHLALVEEFAELAALAVAHASMLAEVRAQAETLADQQRELARLLEVREAEVAGLREEVRNADDRKGYRGLVGRAPAMQRVFRLIDRLAQADVPVVIHGESGTGKELVARAMHDAGPRAAGPFVAENCGAIPETLLESVLFGHAKGSFTGASSAKAGLFEAADGGTIFLDEVGEMSPGMQTKLLRVLQEGEVRRVGENASRPIDVRVIAASNRDLDAMVAAGTFRRDLYYRINVVGLSLPALRERSDDIPALIEHFLRRHAPARPLVVPTPVMRVLCSYAWPGNVRELENEVQRWVALCEGTVNLEDLGPALRGEPAPAGDPDDLRIRPRVDKLERDLIDRALERTGGNQTKAAELLGLSRYGLQKKLRRLHDG